MWVLVTIKILKKGATKERELKLARDVRDDASIGRTLNCQLLASSHPQLTKALSQEKEYLIIFIFACRVMCTLKRFGAACCFINLWCPCIFLIDIIILRSPLFVSKADFPFFFLILRYHVWKLWWLWHVLYLAKIDKGNKKTEPLGIWETHTHVISHVGRIAAHGYETFLSKSPDCWTFFSLLCQIREAYLD